MNQTHQPLACIHDIKVFDGNINRLTTQKTHKHYYLGSSITGWKLMHRKEFIFLI